MIKGSSIQLYLWWLGMTDTQKGWPTQSHTLGPPQNLSQRVLVHKSWVPKYPSSITTWEWNEMVLSKIVENWRFPKNIQKNPMVHYHVPQWLQSINRRKPTATTGFDRLLRGILPQHLGWQVANGTRLSLVRSFSSGIFRSHFCVSHPHVIIQHSSQYTFETWVHHFRNVMDGKK